MHILQLDTAGGIEPSGSKNTDDCPFGPLLPLAIALLRSQIPQKVHLLHLSAARSEKKILITILVGNN